MKKSWRSTAIGAVLATVIAVQPIIETGNVNWKQLAMAALVALLGYVVKDGNVTHSNNP